MFFVTTWLEVLVFSLFCWGLWVMFLKRRQGQIFDKLGIAFPKPGFIFGNLKWCGFLKTVSSHYPQFSHNKVFGIFAGIFPLYVVCDPDIIRKVLVKEFGHFTNRISSSGEQIKSVRLSMLALKDDHWKRVRATVSPTFTSGKLKTLSQRVEITAQSMVECLMEKQGRNEEMELKTLFSYLTMDLIASVGFGVELNSLENPSDPFVRHAKMSIRNDNIHVIVFLAAFCPFLFPFWLILAAGKQKRGVDFFDRFVDFAFKNRKEDRTERSKDFLQLMVDAEKNMERGHEGLTLDEIKGQALVFLLGGYEMVSTVLSFVLFMLAVHPECCWKIQEEIDEIIGPHAVPNYDNVQSLEYLNMCVSETLRIYPPAYVLTRQVKENIEIDGFTFLQGHNLMVPVYDIHHDPRYWPEPEDFIPERFTAENKVTRHPSVYLPFGQGPRNCVGVRLAQLEMNIILSSILQRLTPVTCDKTVYSVTLEGNMNRAKDDVWVKMKKR